MESKGIGSIIEAQPKASRKRAQPLLNDVGVSFDTVDFSDPNRLKTCLEIDFPIVPINRVAGIEGKGSGALKPIYQVSKWWARRRSSVFRAMLLSAGIKAPDENETAAKHCWDSYYKNHQATGFLNSLTVADLFMGGGTTIVEGSRLGMKMIGNDLNPVAWFVVKTSLAKVTKEEVLSLYADIEAEVKPELAPYMQCRGPNGEEGKWIRISTNEVMDSSFDPLSLTPQERHQYKYEGPEIVYAFWAKHGPCPISGCGHETPLMTSPVVAQKEIATRAWSYKCVKCTESFDVEAESLRMAPEVAFVIDDNETKFTTLAKNGAVTCPHCGHIEKFARLGEKKKKKVKLTLLVGRTWLQGCNPLFARPQVEKAEPTICDDEISKWLNARAAQIDLIEFRGALPDRIVLPDGKHTIETGSGTVPGRSNFQCSKCGTQHDMLSALKARGRAGLMAPYAIQAYQPSPSGLSGEGIRYYLPANDPRQMDAAYREWQSRSATDLSDFWPHSEVPYGFMTGMANGDIRTGHGFTHWSSMFNARQLLTHSLLLRAIHRAGGSCHRWEVREVLLAAFQQYLRNQNLFCFWNMQRALEPMFSNNNFHPKMNPVENSCFTGQARGDFRSCVMKILDSLEWCTQPWDIKSDEKGEHSEKVYIGDVPSGDVKLICGSATSVADIGDRTVDLVITDPPFGGLLHYSELSDFFYVWLRLILKESYPDLFSTDYTPKTLEAVANRARNPEDADLYYQRLLTESWREANRILKEGGILAFTFHHSEDEPWISVLESLFNAGFVLEATYPIRSDETKGEGEFGSKKIEYDIIHVCRKRVQSPERISWPRLRRQIVEDIRQIRNMLEHHSNQGLPEADLQVIKRGKALEYFSRHFGNVFIDEGREFTVRDALVGINQIIIEDDEVSGKSPPPQAEPFSRQFLSIFGDSDSIARDQIQKFMKGTGASPIEFVERGWCFEQKKLYIHVPPLEFAKSWVGKPRAKLLTDLDQALFLIGACVEGSGISAADTLNNARLKPHPALEYLLEWYRANGSSSVIRNAALRAQTIFHAWKRSHQKESAQMDLFING